ncbi:MAG: dihydroneopterin aldolase [Paracoccaceae bacterium]
MTVHPDVSAALGPLSERAEGGPPDRIAVRDLTRQVEVGVFADEHGTTQTLRFSIVVDVAAPPGGDDVDAILSYDRLHEAVDAALADGRADLLETLAQRIADRILAHPPARRVLLRIEKTDRGPFTLGVEIARDAGGAAAADPPPRAPILSTPPRRGPAIVLPPPPDLPMPAATGRAARRIALLARDQAAWALSDAIDLPLVATATELDWSLRQGMAVVWAPARMVGDEDAPDLPAWLSERLWGAA